MKRILSLLLCLFSLQVSIAKEPLKRVLVGSPIRQNPKILKEFCDSLDRLEKTSYTLDYCFIDDNNVPESSGVLAAFADQHPYQCLILPPDVNPNSSHYTVNESGHVWTDHLIWKVAAFKNKIIDIAKEEYYDYLFLIDSDLVLHPKTLEQLLSAKKDILCNVFWTCWQPNSLEMPQVWIQDEYNFYKVVNNKKPSTEAIRQKMMEFFSLLRNPGVYEVGGLGACTLISRDALLKGVSFDKIKNLAFWGEDRHFCVRAAAIGIPLFVDTHYPAYHIYRMSYLEGVKNFIELCEETPSF